MRKFVLVPFVSLLAADSILAAQAPAPAARVTAIKAGRLVDPETGTSTANQVIIVEGEKIKAVGANLPTPPGAVIQFGQLEFTLCDAGTCWDLVRKKS